MELSVISTGSFMTNCWLLKDEKTGKAILVDPGFYDEALEKFLSFHGVKELEYILVTHGHTDHTCGVSHVKEKFGGSIVIGKEDAYLLKENRFLLGEPDYVASFRPCEADITVEDGDELDFAGNTIKIMHTPGHIPGEVCYIINDMFFAGDVLFKGSMGRTDLAGGNVFVLFSTLKRIAALKENYIILPGHGEKTTLEYEKTTNRYLKAACSRK